MRAWWAAAKRRFWGSWHALAGYLPNAEPPLADHERLPPSPDAVLDFVEAVLSSAGEQRLLAACTACDADGDGFLTYNETQQVAELLLLPMQRAAFELYRLHLDRTLPQIAGSADSLGRLPPESGLIYLPMVRARVCAYLCVLMLVVFC